MSSSDIAFALRLTWQASGTQPQPAIDHEVLPAPSSQSDPSFSGASAKGSSIDAPGLTWPPAGLSEGASLGEVASLSEVASLTEVASHTGIVSDMAPTDVERKEVSAPDAPKPESQSYRGNDPLTRPSSSLLPSIPDPNASSPEGAGIQFAETSEQFTLPPMAPVHPERSSQVGISKAPKSPDAFSSSTETDGNEYGTSAALERDSVWEEAVASPDERDAPSQILLRPPASVLGRTPASPVARGRNQEIPLPNAETGAEVSPPQGPGLEQSRGPETATARRSLATPSGSSGSTQETSANSSGTAAGRDGAETESDAKAARVPIAEKAPQIQASSAPSPQGTPGVWLDQVSKPGSAVEAQSNSQAPAARPSSADTTEPEITGLGINAALPSQPIQEISLRLSDASANVDVQVAQRAGKVQVAVRASDPELAQSLQTNLGELVGRLQDKGFKTEAWTPILAQHGSAVVRAPGSSGNSPGDSADSRSGGGQPDQRQGQQESNQRQPGRSKTQLKLDDSVQQDAVQQDAVQENAI
jgi:hypothetical protein